MIWTSYILVRWRQNHQRQTIGTGITTIWCWKHSEVRKWHFFHDAEKPMLSVTDGLEVIKDLDISTISHTFSTVTNIFGSIPATSCCAESLFSWLGNNEVISQKHNGACLIEEYISSQHRETVLVCKIVYFQNYR